MTNLPHSLLLYMLANELEAGTVPALSILQPWCHHIFHDGKNVENRKWRTKHRGWFAIHAGKKDREDPDMIRQLSLPLGGVVGFARLTDCVDRYKSDWWQGPYGFLLADAFPVPLLPYRGENGFFPLSQEARASLAQTVRELGSRAGAR